jgi:hypothetical protein
VAQGDPPDLPLEGWLKTLGIDSLIQWDVLAFVYRHRTSLVGAEAIARLLGYANDPVVAALDVLEALEFVGRSRATHGVRLYQFTLPPDPTRRDFFERLNALAESRAGRLRLIEVLRPRDQAAPEGHQGVPDALGGAGPSLPIGKLRPAPAARLYPPDDREEEGGTKWLKVI